MAKIIIMRECYYRDIIDLSILNRLFLKFFENDTSCMKNPITDFLLMLMLQLDLEKSLEKSKKEKNER